MVKKRLHIVDRGLEKGRGMQCAVAFFKFFDK